MAGGPMGALGEKLDFFTFVFMATFLTGMRGSQASRFTAYFHEIAMAMEAQNYLTVIPGAIPCHVAVSPQPSGNDSEKIISSFDGATFIFHSGSTQVDNLIYMKSDQAVEVLGLGGALGIMAAQRLLPYSSLGLDYPVLAFLPNHGYSFLAVVATDTPTMVEISFNTDVVVDGAITSFHVLDLTSSQAWSMVANVDLTGTRVRSYDAVAVFAGGWSLGTSAPFLLETHVAEQMLPTEYWGNYYVAIATGDSSTDSVVKVVALESDTVVANEYTEVTLSRFGDVWEIQVDYNYILLLKASRPVAVAQVISGNSNADSCMTSLVPTGRWLTAYSAIVHQYIGARQHYHVMTYAAYRANVWNHGYSVTMTQTSAYGDFWGGTVGNYSGSVNITCYDVVTRAACKLVVYLVVITDSTIVCTPLDAADVDSGLEEVMPTSTLSSAPGADMTVTDASTSQTPHLGSSDLTLEIFPSSSTTFSTESSSPFIVSSTTSLTALMDTVSLADVGPFASSLQSLYSLTVLSQISSHAFLSPASSFSSTSLEVMSSGGNHVTYSSSKTSTGAVSLTWENSGLSESSTTSHDPSQSLQNTQTVLEESTQSASDLETPFLTFFSVTTSTLSLLENEGLVSSVDLEFSFMSTWEEVSPNTVHQFQSMVLNTSHVDQSPAFVSPQISESDGIFVTSAWTTFDQGIDVVTTSPLQESTSFSLNSVVEKSSAYPSFHFEHSAENHLHVTTLSTVSMTSTDIPYHTSWTTWTQSVVSTDVASVATHPDASPSTTATASQSSSTTPEPRPSSTTPELSPSSTTQDYSPSSTTQDYSPSSTTQDYSPSSTTPEFSSSSTTQEYSPSSTTQDYSPSSTTLELSPTSTTPEHSPSSTTPELSPNSTTPELSPTSTISELSPTSTTTEFSPNSTTPEHSPSSTTPELSPTSITQELSQTSTISELVLSSTTPELSPSSTTPELSPVSTTQDFSPSSTTPELGPTSTISELGPSSTIEELSPTSTSQEHSPSSTTPELSQNSTISELGPSSTTQEHSPSSTTPKLSSTSTISELGPSSTTQEHSPSSTTEELGPSSTISEFGPSSTIPELSQNSTTPELRPSRLCSCQCRSQHDELASKSQLEAMRESIHRELAVNTSSTSAAIRKRISIPDSRPQSKFIGGVAIIIVLVVVLVIVLPDIPLICKDARHLPGPAKVTSAKRRT